MTTSASEVTPNRRGTRSREVVLGAAERVMAAEGYAGTSVARVVKAAGVPASSIYHYFGSKDGLLLAVLERGARRFFVDLAALSVEVDVPDRRLERTVDGLCRALERHPDFLRLLVVMALQPPPDAARLAHDTVSRIRREALSLLQATYLALVEGTTAHDAERLARFTLALIDGAFLAAQTDDGVTLGSTLDLLPRLVARLDPSVS